MRNETLFLCFFVIFSACSSHRVSDGVLEKCNAEQAECNKQAHAKSCSASDSGCLKEMLTQPNWSNDEFKTKIQECNSTYQKCLHLQ